MAAGTLPAPGTKFGPCKKAKCGHKDCAATRADAAALCRFCDKAVGYGEAVLPGVEEAVERNDARLGEF